MTPSSDLGLELDQAPAARPWLATVGECLRNTAEVAPENGIQTYSRRREEELVTYPELLHRSEAFARYLIEEGAGPGVLVGLAIPTSVELFVGFFGCLFARATPVTLSLPTRVGSSRDRGAQRLKRILVESDLDLLLDGYDLDPASLAVDGLRVRRLSDPGVGVASGGPLPRPRPDDLGLVQFTSGSLSRPKGVCLSQRSISFNIQAIVDAVEMNRTDTIDLWIPLYHDMGLMGSLTAIASQGNLRLCNPLQFLADPLGWLLRFAERRSTINPSPHFFYRMLIEAYDPDRVADLDLSSWRVGFNGAEPVRAEELERFVELYGPHGFAETTMYPVYGLAEATLAALFPRYGERPRVVHGEEAFTDAAATAWLRERRFVSVGRPLVGHEARLVPCPDDEGLLDLPAGIGELHLRGPSITRGYLNRPEETRRLVDDDGWISTGDLAFRHDGEYFICGRIKEVVIIRGENYFPEDFEALVDRIRPSLAARVTGRAAFAYAHEETEALGLAVELDPETAEEERDRLLERLRGEVHELAGLAPTIFLLAPRAIPRTTSGKLQRLLLSRELESGSIVPWAFFPPAELR